MNCSFTSHTVIAKRPHIMTLLTLSFQIGILTYLLLGTPIQSATRDAVEVCKMIRGKFECELFTLEPATQRHYAVRMFRITGDDKYIYPIIVDLFLTTNDLSHDMDHFDDSAYIAMKASALLGEFNDKTRKGRLRRKLFDNKRRDLFYLNFLDNINRVADYGLEDPESTAMMATGLARLREIDFSRILLDTSMVRVYGPQAVNYVYYLHRLGITDIRDLYLDVFQRVFPDSSDDSLTAEEFRDKIYSLTHFVFAASDYYQHMVQPDEFAWIFSYFAVHMNRILDQTTADIIAEVGLCYLLTGRASDPVVQQYRDATLDAIDPAESMILSPSGSDDIEKGEHRNILAYMLLNWPDHLYPGPNLEQFGQYRRLRGP